jgi:hypothetical protein
MTVNTSVTVPTINGSTASGGDLTLVITSNVTKGNIFFGDSTYDEVNDRLGINQLSPELAVHVGQAPTGVYLDSVNNDGLLFAPNNNRGILAVEGNTEGWVTICDRGGTANQRMMGIQVDGAFGHIKSINDSLGVRSTPMTFDLNNVRVGINEATPGAALHVNQSGATRTIPAMTIEQADVSEEMIELLCTIGTGNAIEAVGAKSLTTTHFIKVTVQGGLTRYFPVGTIA